MIEASESNRLYCPVASETIAETTGLPAECRIRIYELHSFLAGSRDGGPLWAFKDMWKMINEETLALGRSLPRPNAYERFHWVRIGDDNLAKTVSSDLKIGKLEMQERVDFHSSSNHQINTSMDPRGERKIPEHVAHVFRQIGRLRRGENLCADDHMGISLCEYLQANGINDVELDKLSEDLVHHRWEDISVVISRTKLAAQLERDFVSSGNPRKYKVNDELDIPRLAVGLTNADVIITDSSMAQLCKTAKTSQWTRTKVFSIRETRQIIEYLEHALSSRIN